jgi:hypothetical protein
LVDPLIAIDFLLPGPAISETLYASSDDSGSQRGLRFGLMISTDCGGESSNDSSFGLPAAVFGFFFASRCGRSLDAIASNSSVRWAA